MVDKLGGVLPALKKKIGSFLVEEEGRISKKSLVTAGLLLAGASFVNAACDSHSQNISHSDSSSMAYAGTTITATHDHYDPAHCNHGSHCNYFNDDCWNSCGCDYCCIC